MKWYVNLPRRPAHQEGDMLPLRVPREVWEGLGPSNPESRQLGWVVDPDPGNVPANISTAMSARAQEASGLDPTVLTFGTRVTPPRTATFTNGKTTPESSDGEFHNGLLLPHTGGDIFTVSAHKVASDGSHSTDVEIEEIVTWRRVYYDFYYANAACLKLFEDIEDRLSSYFAGAFIELSRDTLGELDDVPFTTDDPGVLANGKPTLGHAPNHLRLMLVERYGVIMDEYKEFTLEVSAVSAPEAEWSSRVEREGAMWRFRVRLPQRRVFQERAWFKRIVVMMKDAGGDQQIFDTSSSSEDEDDDFSTILVDESEVVVSIDASYLSAIDTEDKSRRCRVRLDYSYVDDQGGSSGGGNILVARRSLFHADDPAKAEEAVLAAFVHEIGHGIGMVDVVSDNFYFTDHGTAGRHCSTGTDSLPVANTDRCPEIPRTPTLSHNVFLPKEGGTGHDQCVMFHSRWEGMHASHFCGDCIRIMKTMHIEVRPF